jgi:hypothetical protein
MHVEELKKSEGCGMQTYYWPARTNWNYKGEGMLVCNFEHAPDQWFVATDKTKQPGNLGLRAGPFDTAQQAVNWIEMMKDET